MKKLFLAIVTIFSFSLISTAATDATSPYYVKELKQLVKDAPTDYAKNIALHYLKLAKASKKAEATDFVLSANDLSMLKKAFGSSPELVALIVQIEAGQEDLVLTLETVGDLDLAVF
jgi:hypothetical protein